MPNNYYQGGFAPQSGQQTDKQKEKTNQWVGIGIVNPRGRNQEIKFFPFANGGGAIHITLVCTEFTGQSDQNGNPLSKTCYVPVNFRTNRNITAQQLQEIKTGMKIRVVGRLTIESYDDRQTGQKRSYLVVDAFVLDILEIPMQMQYNGYGQQPQSGYAQPQAPQYPTQPQASQYPQGGYAQPQAPQYPQGGYAQPQAPQYPQGGYAQPQAPQYPAQQAGGQGPVPPYYQQPVQSQQQSGAPLPPEGDLPN